MSTSLRLACIERHLQIRKKKHATLNMISLMDIFTILVFFLLVSSVDSEILPSPKAISLPKSISDQQPQKSLVIMVNGTDIQINGKKVVEVSRIDTSNTELISPLLDSLRGFAQQEFSEDPQKKSLSITIMGDKQIPYDLLKKIMLTCTAARYSSISLAVIQKQLARK